MLEQDKLPPAELPESLQDALKELDLAYDAPQQLLQANVSALEAIGLCIFAYFSRDEVFYVNQTGRRLLSQKLPLAEPAAPAAPPIFWLEDEESFHAADRFVLQRGAGLPRARELVTLSWGKTWVQGWKLPLRSRQGKPMAILFAGRECAASDQIGRIAEHFQLTQTGFSNN